MNNYKAQSAKQIEFLMNQINKLYCAQYHLYERLSEIMDQPNFNDLRASMQETVNEMEEQIKNTGELYAGYNCTYSFENCGGILHLLEEDFKLVQENSGDIKLRDMTMLNYIQNAQNVITSAFQFLMLNIKDLTENIGKIVSRNFEAIKSAQSFKLVLIDQMQQL